MAARGHRFPVISRGGATRRTSAVGILRSVVSNHTPPHRHAPSSISHLLHSNLLQSHQILSIPYHYISFSTTSSSTILHGTFAQGARLVVARSGPTDRPVRRTSSTSGGFINVDEVRKLTSGLIDQVLQRHRRRSRTGCDGPSDGQRRAGGVLLGTRNSHPSWLSSATTSRIRQTTDLTDAALDGSDAVTDDVRRWLDDGQSPNGAQGRAFR